MSDLPPPPPMPAGGVPSSPVSIGDAFSYGWKKFTQYAGPLILIVLVVFLGYGLLQGFSFVIQRGGNGGFGRFFLALLIGAVGIIVGFVLEYGIVRAALAVTDGRRPTFAEAWNMERFGPFVVAAILRGVIVGVGYLLCIIPGLIAAFFLLFTPFFVIDQNMAPVQALSASFNLVKDNAGKLLLFCIVATLVYIAGAIACLVGLLVSVPVALVATAYMYKRTAGEPVAP